MTEDNISNDILSSMKFNSNATQMKTNEKHNTPKETFNNTETFTRTTDLPLYNINVEPIEIDVINDSEGYIGHKVKSECLKFGISVLPFHTLKLLPQIESIKDHMIIRHNNVKYVSGTNYTVNEGNLSLAENEILQCLLRGTAYDESIIISVNVNGTMIETLKFNIYELSYLKSKFIKFPFRAYITSGGDCRISVG